MTRRPEVVVARLRNGSRLVVRVDDVVGRTILYLGDYDPKITWICRRLLRPGDVMLDVGANMGVVSVVSSPLVGPSGQVHAFEPQPELVDTLERSLVLNGMSNVTVHPVALSNVDGHLPLSGVSGNLGRATLEPPDRDHDLTGITVQVQRADRYLEGLGVDSVRLLKLDIEDHEESFLRGAEGYLRTVMPAAIVFESHGSSSFHDRPPVQILGRLSYTFFQIPKALFRIRLTPVPRSGPPAPGFDFVAISPGAPDVRHALGCS
jgi:FkbM family methyltransferase